MAAIPHYAFNITGATGTQGALAPLQSYRAYIFPRGANASQDSTSTTITFDSAAIASRFSANNWVQVGTAIANIRRVTAVGGDSITVNTAVTVSENNRVFLIGNTQPTTAGGSATYTTPNTIIRTRGDDAADIVANSMLTSNVDGLVEFYAAPNMYDALIQDGDRGPAGYIADLEVGSVEGISALDAAYFGSTVTFSGNQVGISSSGAATFGATVTFLAGVSMNLSLVVGSTVTGSTGNFDALRTSIEPWINVKHPDYGAVGDGSNDDTSAIQLALNTGASNGVLVFFPPGEYKVTSTITLNSNTGIRGTGPLRHAFGTTEATIVFSPAAGSSNTSLFQNSSTGGGLSWFTCEDISLLGAAGATPDNSESSQHAFNLFGVFNQTNFRRVVIHRFDGDAFRLTNQSGAGDATTAIGGIHFDQCGIFNCGGYAWNVTNGNMTFLASAPEVNSCVGGVFKSTDGTNNQDCVVFVNGWFEGSAAWASTTPVKLTNAQNLNVVFVGCNFAGPSGGVDVINIDGASGANPSLINCVAFTYTNWVNDTVGSLGTVPYTANIFYVPNGVNTSGLTIRQNTPTFDFLDANGTTDSRKWRMDNSGASMRITSVLDDNTLSKRFMSLVHTTGHVELSDGTIGLSDGITEPTTKAGTAYIYVDSADGDFKIKFGDGFVRTLGADS